MEQNAGPKQQDTIGFTIIGIPKKEEPVNRQLLHQRLGDVLRGWLLSKQLRKEQNLEITNGGVRNEETARRVGNRYAQCSRTECYRVLCEWRIIRKYVARGRASERETQLDV